VNLESVDRQKQDSMIQNIKMNQPKTSFFFRFLKRSQPWLGVAGLLGAGLLPCPECGAPLLWHFWPIAAVLALRNIIQERKQRRSNPLAVPEAVMDEKIQCCREESNG